MLQTSKIIIFMEHPNVYLTGENRCTLNFQFVNNFTVTNDTNIYDIHIFIFKFVLET